MQCLYLSILFSIYLSNSLSLIILRLKENFIAMKLKGMTFDHDFCYFILLFSSLLKKEGREKENDVAKIVIKSHTFLFHLHSTIYWYIYNSKKNYERYLLNIYDKFSIPGIFWMTMVISIIFSFVLKKYLFNCSFLFHLFWILIYPILLVLVSFYTVLFSIVLVQIYLFI